MIVILIALTGLLLGGQVNRAIYRLAWNKRQISPWSAPPEGVSDRTWSDRIPVLGWLRLRRETSIHGSGFWIRPALIEIFLGIGLAWLYLFELDGGLLPIGHEPVDTITHRWQFLSHAVLIVLMTVATFIDLDEKTIPDEITVPGTLLAVAFAGFQPQCLMPYWKPSAPPLAIDRLLLSSPHSWPLQLDGNFGLGIALLCIAAWWYGLLPKTLWYRGGIRKFSRYLIVSVFRHPFSVRIHMLGLVAGIATSMCWAFAPPASWHAVLTAWVGMAVGGGIVWLVRIVGAIALRQEAMGFGDVTLMGMIGAFLGWQPALVIFFVAPFTGVFIAIAQWMVTGRKDIAYGPFLCLATLIVMLFWPVVWTRWGYALAELGGLLPAVLVASLMMLGAMLIVVQRIKSLASRASSVV